jgi:hypothetical protein
MFNNPYSISADWIIARKYAKDDEITDENAADITYS